MSRPFVQLCRDVVTDLGIAGGSLQSVSGASLNQEQLRVIAWVARADLLIQNLWADWSFLWFQDTAVVVQANASQLVVTLPPWASAIQSIDHRSLWQNYGTPTARPIAWMEWELFVVTYQSRPKTTTTNPAVFSQDPAGNLWLSNNMASLTSFTLSYWCVGKRMANDGDVSQIPINFDQIICERAKMLYAQRENASEIMAGSVAEYTDGLDKLQAWGLPGNTAGRKSRNDQTTLHDGYVE